MIQLPEYEIAQAVLNGIEDAFLLLGKTQGPIPNVYPDERVNQMWSSPSPILSQDLEGKLNFCNPAASQFFGYELQEFLGMDSLNLVPKDPDVRTRRAQFIKRIQETGNAMTFQDSLRIKKDGSPVIVTRWSGFRYPLNGQYSFGAMLYP